MMIRQAPLTTKEWMTLMPNWMLAGTIYERKEEEE